MNPVKTWIRIESGTVGDPGLAVIVYDDGVDIETDTRMVVNGETDDGWVSVPFELHELSDDVQAWLGVVLDAVGLL